MLQQQNFLSPRLTGKRFDDHAIPLEIFEDFAAFQELLVEVAKWLYFKENSERQRVPRGFVNDISLKVISVDEGSSVLNIILAAMSTIGSSGANSNIQYFENAKEHIIKAVDAAESNKDITEFIPSHLLVYFNQIGKGLRDDESMDLSPNTIYNATLNKTTRKRLVLASSATGEIFFDLKVFASVPEVDKDKNTFTIIFNDGQRVTSQTPKEFKKIILEAFYDYESKRKIKIEGVGLYNKFDKLIKIEEIKHITLLDSLDVFSRIHDLSKLQDGWYNGEGKSLSLANLTWFAETFETYYDTTLKLPYLYPTINGGVQAEWISTDRNYDVSLNVDIETKNGYFHILNNSDDSVVERELDMSNKDDWEYVNRALIEILKKS